MNPESARAIEVSARSAYGVLDRALRTRLLALMRMLVRNRNLLDALESGLARLSGIAMRAWHAFKRNTRMGSRRNIAAHYDLGNDFFHLFLDDNMMYSSAIFADAEESLEV